MAISQQMRIAILERDKFTCQYCGARAPFVQVEVDHVTPSALGGSDERENLQTACFACNRGKHHTPITPPFALNWDAATLLSFWKSHARSSHQQMPDDAREWLGDLLEHDGRCCAWQAFPFIVFGVMQWALAFEEEFDCVREQVNAIIAARGLE